MPRMSYSRRMVGLKLWVIACANTRNRASVQGKLSDLLLDFVGAGDAEARDHLPKLLPCGDVADADLAQLLQVEQGQALGKQLAIDDALAETRNDSEADAASKFVHCRADALQIVRFDMLQAVSQHHPVDALAALLGALGAAVPDQLGVETGLGDLVIFRVDLTDQVEVDKAVVHRSNQCVGLKNRRARD